MSRAQKTSQATREHRIEKWLGELLTAYLNRQAPTGTAAQKAHFDATQQVDDLAFHDPETFWQFLEVALASEASAEDLGDIGWGPLTWLLRYYPDDFVERVEGLSRRDDRMRRLVASVEHDRVAPDIWRRLEIAIDGAT